jgi:predicted O-methyltransferase YrrM
MSTTRSTIKQTLHRLPGMRFATVLRQRLALRGLRQAPCDATSLSRKIDQVRLKEIFASQQMNDEWPAIERTIASLKIADGADGVNLGDRRALYYLVRCLSIRSMLEIGTSIGASTVCAVAALQTNHCEDINTPHRLTSVDVLAVNDEASTPWLRSGSTYSPKEMVMKIGAADYVTFMTVRSIDHLRNCKDGYDLIFVDGDHAATTVYQEIPLALRVLNQGGVILLHDYFPDLRPLWSNGAVIPGPWLATERLNTEHEQIQVLALGHLPWRTKLDSDVTSLALVVGG